MIWRYFELSYFLVEKLMTGNYVYLISKTIFDRKLVFFLHVVSLSLYFKVDRKLVVLCIIFWWLASIVSIAGITKLVLLWNIVFSVHNLTWMMTWMEKGFTRLSGANLLLCDVCNIMHAQVSYLHMLMQGIIEGVLVVSGAE